MLAPGSRVGPYEVLNPLGAGGMGEVYQARDERLARDVAIKVLPPALSTDPDRVRQFEQEARTVGALSHPNLLTVHDAGVHDGGPYIAFELLDGTTLRHALDKGRMPLRKVLDYGFQIASGLAAAHEKGIVHRDVKPDNLFVTDDGRVKILDFGLAKLRRELDADSRSGEITASDVTGAGLAAGTVGYMSPEQIQGRPADHRSDIFSLGCVLYEMLAGRRAFKGSSAVETLNAILKEEPEEFPATAAIPPALVRTVRRCLEKGAPERFQSARDLAFALQALSGASAAASLRVPAPGRARWLPRLLVGLGGALALATLGALAGRALWKQPPLSFERLTFQRGRVTSARLAPDGHTVIYAAAWQGAESRIEMTRVGTRESAPLALPPGNVVAISSVGELAILQQGVLSRAPLTGGAPRDVLGGVTTADWSPDGGQLAVLRDGQLLEYPIGRRLLQAAPGELATARLSPDGKLFAILSVSAQSINIEVVDLEGRRKVLATDLGRLRGIAWSPSGDEIWFGAKRKGDAPGWNVALRAVSLSGHERVLLQLPALAYLFDVSPQGRVLLAVGSQHAEMFGWAPGEPRERELSWHESSYVQDLSSDGRTLLFHEWVEERYREGGGLYMRAMDGGPARRIGEGYPSFLSPDGRQVATCPPEFQPGDRLELIPTGVGESRMVPLPGLECIAPRWFPDGRRLLVRGAVPEGGPLGPRREYLVTLPNGAPRPLTPPGTVCQDIAPGGSTLVCQDAHGAGLLLSLDGGAPRPVRGLLPGDRIAGMRDERTLLLHRSGERPGGWPAQFLWLDLPTGRRTLHREIAPADMAGVVPRDFKLVNTRDFGSYAYSYSRELNALYLVDGLR